MQQIVQKIGTAVIRGTGLPAAPIQVPDEMPIFFRELDELDITVLLLVPRDLISD